MREIRSYGSVGEREGNDPLYPDDCHSVVNSVVIRLYSQEMQCIVTMATGIKDLNVFTIIQL